MGIAVSNWRLARSVSLEGQLGVVSGTAIDTVLVRRLQDGDEGGHVRRAMAAFPIPGVAESILKKFYLPAGRAPGQLYALLAMPRQVMRPERVLVNIMAAFVEVFLAKEGHDGVVGINLLTKVQIPNLPALYGAMLADVDAVLMGAGIPKEIPGSLDHLAKHETASLRLDVEDMPAGREERLTFDPMVFWGDHTPPPIRRPFFLAIIASTSLATMLTRKANGHVDGFIIEGPTAGGHNAPPRGKPTFTASGEPVYGERDEVDLDQVAALGRPFWLAGGSGRKGGLADALAAGAHGIQVGTLFAYCEESGLSPELKRSVVASSVSGELKVRTDPRASPTGYPFKIVSWPGGPGSEKPRERKCDLGYLRVPYARPDGRIDYRCSSEPIKDYVRKGGTVEETEGRKCLCNALASDIDMAQIRDNGELEPAIVTSGDDLQAIQTFLAGRTAYTAADVLDYLLAAVPAAG
jgi:NAD(P)H-dependent flavin oxidoreductase YrpB (nitropropane dioxygenase family)